MAGPFNAKQCQGRQVKCTQNGNSLFEAVLLENIYNPLITFVLRPKEMHFIHPKPT